jgi:glycosyltransferase involved in cell wall biosynthesis
MTNIDLIERNETNKNSRGGTELLQERLYDGRVPRELLEQFQIVFSRVRDLDESRFRIFYAHDLPGDPESEFLHNGGWRKFHKIVFVSNWQMQAYVSYYNIPWSHCEVIENSIIPIVDGEHKPVGDGPIRICYTPTPHRGLNILFAAFEALAKERDDIVLDVFSSFKLYGWEQRDESYKELFEALREHPQVNYHGTKSNDEIRHYLANEGHIFAYPSKWPETSCLCLIEAMSAGLMCVHSNFGALSDTSGGHTHMYQYHEDENAHATKLYHLLKGCVTHYSDDSTGAIIKLAKTNADYRFNWFIKSSQWTGLLTEITMRNPDKALPKAGFTYRA